MSDEMLTQAAAAYAVSKEAAQTISKFVEALGLPAAKSFGSALGKYVDIRAQKILLKAEAKCLENGVETPKLSISRQECVQRSIFMGALSSGEDLLDYFAGVVKAQIVADSDVEADLAGGTLSALQQLTDTHVHALVHVADLVAINDDDELIQPRLGSSCCFSTADRKDALHPLSSAAQSLIINDLLRLRLLGVSGTGYGGTGDLFLTNSGLELLRFGGWTPRNPFSWERNVFDMCDQERTRIACCCGTKHKSFDAIDLALSTSSQEINIVLADGTYNVNGYRACGPSQFITIWERFGQFLGSLSPISHDDCGPLSAIKKALRDRTFSAKIGEFVNLNNSTILRVERLDSENECQRWSVALINQGTRKERIDVSISPPLYKSMEELYEITYRPLFNPSC